MSESLADPAPASAFKRLWNASKYIIALGVLIAVINQADLPQLADHAASIPIIYLIAAFACFTLSQLITVLRMNAYYRHAGRSLDFIYSLKLHYVGLFYNIILPGGIGGDGYKVYLLKKRADYPVKEGIRIQLATRTNGLLVLLYSLFATIPFLPLPYDSFSIAGAMIALALLTTILYRAAAKWMLCEQSQMEWQALPYSFGVQLFSILAMAFLWWPLAQGSDLPYYILLFQCAAIAGMIPITIGGLGLREFTFFYGTAWLNHHFGSALDAEIGVVISLLIFAFTALSALIGIFWISRIRQMTPCEAQVN